MTTSLQLLNGVQQYMIQFANEKGISLQDEFGTVEAFKKFVIAFTFKTLVDMGIETKQAYDLCFGEGRFDELVDKVWNNANKGK